MKKIIITLFFSINGIVFADTVKQKTSCEALYKLTIKNCLTSICKGILLENKTPVNSRNINSCISEGGGDLLEGASSCARDEGEFEKQVRKFNIKNPKDQIDCSEF